MNKDLLLKSIAETAYNVGYGAKLHFASYDLIEKLPGSLGFIQLVIGIYALFIPALATNQVSAILLVFGISTLYLAMYQPRDRQAYEEVGKALTGKFNDLKNLYYKAKSRPDSTDFSDLINEHEHIQSSVVGMSLSKQVLFSDWLAHYKFFWQQQIDWVDEQKHFRFIRDKVPLTAWVAVTLLTAAALPYLLSKIDLLTCLFQKG